jgi:dephospho-CoA kinase
MPAELKRARADIVIDNDTTIGELERKVSEAWASLVGAESPAGVS